MGPAALTVLPVMGTDKSSYGIEFNWLKQQTHFNSYGGSNPYWAHWFTFSCTQSSKLQINVLWVPRDGSVKEWSPWATARLGDARPGEG